MDSACVPSTSDEDESEDGGSPVPLEICGPGRKRRAMQQGAHVQENLSQNCQLAAQLAAAAKRHMEAQLKPLEKKIDACVTAAQPWTFHALTRMDNADDSLNNAAKRKRFMDIMWNNKLKAGQPEMYNDFAPRELVRSIYLADDEICEIAGQFNAIEKQNDELCPASHTRTYWWGQKGLTKEWPELKKRIYDAKQKLNDWKSALYAFMYVVGVTTVNQTIGHQAAKGLSYHLQYVKAIVTYINLYKTHKLTWLEKKLNEERINFAKKNTTTRWLSSAYRKEVDAQKASHALQLAAANGYSKQMTTMLNSLRTVR